MSSGMIPAKISARLRGRLFYFIRPNLRGGGSPEKRCYIVLPDPLRIVFRIAVRQSSSYASTGGADLEIAATTRRGVHQSVGGIAGKTLNLFLVKDNVL